MSYYTISKHIDMIKYNTKISKQYFVEMTWKCIIKQAKLAFLMTPQIQLLSNDRRSIITRNIQSDHSPYDSAALYFLCVFNRTFLLSNREWRIMTNIIQDNNKCFLLQWSKKYSGMALATVWLAKGINIHIGTNICIHLISAEF